MKGKYYVKMGISAIYCARDVFLRSSFVLKFLVSVVGAITIFALVLDYSYRHNVEKMIVETSLEVELAFVRSLVESALDDIPVDGGLSYEYKERISQKITESNVVEHVSKIKVWGVDGVLIYDSDAPYFRFQDKNLHVEEALLGNKVIVRSDFDSEENIYDKHLGNLLYEIYAPIYNSNQEVIAIIEIYGSEALINEGIRKMKSNLDHTVSFFFFICLFLALVVVWFAQKKSEDMSKCIFEERRVLDNLKIQNLNLEKENSNIHYKSMDAVREFLLSVRDDMYQGPIQFLSLASLLSTSDCHMSNHGPRANAFSSDALVSLRSLSSSLSFPIVEESSLQSCIDNAITEFIEIYDCRAEFSYFEENFVLSGVLSSVLRKVIFESFVALRTYVACEEIFICEYSKSTKIELEISCAKVSKISNVNIGASDCLYVSKKSFEQRIRSLKKLLDCIGGSLGVRENSSSFTIFIGFDDHRLR